MSNHPKSRVFDFYLLEDRILLSGDGLDGSTDVVPDPHLNLIANLESQLHDDPLFGQTAQQALDRDTNVDRDTLDEDDSQHPVAEADSSDASITRTELIIVDAGVDGWETLIDSLQLEAAADTQWVVLHLDGSIDGVQQITELLQPMMDVDALHILSHGDDGSFQLGNTALNQTSINGYAGQLASWDAALSPEADLLIYGCDLAQSDSGRFLLDSIATLCDCDVAASTDVTGHRDLGGDWDLEYQVGQIETDIAISAAAQLSWHNTLASPDEITVTETTDGGVTVNTSGPDTVFEAAASIPSDLDRFTYELTFSGPPTSGSETFLSYNVSGEDQLTFTIDHSTNNLALDIGAGGTVESSQIDYTNALLDGQVHMLSINWDNTAGDWQIYIDGALIDSGSGYQAGQVVQAGGTLVFGQEQDSESGGYQLDERFVGTLYDARLFDDLRTPTEIASNQNVTLDRQTQGLIANWRFDQQTSDGTILDAVGDMHLTRLDTSPPLYLDQSDLSLSVQSLSDDGTVVGQVTASDADREAQISALLAADPDLHYSEETGKFYQLVDTATDWTDAQSTANSTSLQSIAGDLVAVESSLENQIVANIASAASGNVWLAGTDEAIEGQFRWDSQSGDSDVWYSGSSPVNDAYNNFAAGQPDNLGDQDYLQLDGSTGLWRDQANNDSAAILIQWDADEVLDQTQALTYQITSQTVTGAFAIDLTTGTIVVADGSLLDASLLATHAVQVEVNDVDGDTFQRTFQIQITDVNTEQTLAPTTAVTVNEGATTTITTANLSTTDIEQSASEIIYTVTGDVAQGQLFLNGAEVNLGGRFTQADLNAGLVSYANHGEPVTADQFSFSVDDGAGTTTQGSLAINVVLQDDPVVITATESLQSVQGSAIQFGPAGDGSISVFDEEDATITVSLSATDTELAIVATPGVTMIDADGTDGTLQFSGSQDDINATLDLLTVTPDVATIGTIVLNIAVDDGNTVSNDTVDMNMNSGVFTMVWDGGGATDDWSDPLNWDLDLTPDANDTVIFNTTSLSDSQVDAAFAGSVSSVVVTAGYTGQIAQQVDLSVGSDLTLANGTWTTASNVLDIDGDLTVNGGTLNMTDSQVLVGGEVQLLTNVLADNSTLTLDGVGTQSLETTQTLNHLHFDSAGSINVLSDVQLTGDLIANGGTLDFAGNEVNLTGTQDRVIQTAGSALGTINVNTSGTVTVNGDASIAGDVVIQDANAINGDALLIEGDLTIHDDAWTATSDFTMVGGNNQTLSAAGGSSLLPNLTINKSGGTLTWVDDFSLDGNVSVTAGTIDASTMDLQLSPTSGLSIDGDIGPIASLRIDSTFAITIQNTLQVLGTTTLANVSSLARGTLQAFGDVQAIDTRYTGSATFELAGSNDQSITTEGSAGSLRNLTVNKTGGTATVVDDLRLTRAFTYVAGDFDTASALITFESTGVSIDSGAHVWGDVAFDIFSVTTITGDMHVDGDLLLQNASSFNGGSILVTGDVLSTAFRSSTGNTTIQLIGTGDQVLSGNHFHSGDVIIDKISGQVTIAGDLELDATDQDLILDNGTLGLSGQQLTITNGLTLNGGVLTGYGAIVGDLAVGGAAEVALAIDSLAPGGFDQLQVSGNVSLASGASLAADLTGVTTSEDRNGLIQYGSRTGSFTTFRLDNDALGVDANLQYDDLAGSLNLSLNDLPSGNIADINVLEDSAPLVIDLAAVVSDANHADSELTYQIIANSNTTLVTATNLDQDADTLALVFAAEENGTAIITVRVTDPLGAFSDMAFTVTVAEQLDPPTLTAGSINVDEGAEFILTAAQLSASDPDSAADELRYNITSQPRQGVLLVDGLPATSFTQEQLEAGRVSYLHNDSETNGDQFTVQLSDGANTLAPATVNISINPVNDQTPIIDSNGGDATALLAVLENTTLVTTVTATDGDLPAQAIQYSIVGGADRDEFIMDSGTGELSFFPAPDAETPLDANRDGTYEVIVAASDGTRQDTQTLTVSIIDQDEFDVSGIRDIDASANVVADPTVIGSTVGVTVSASDADITNSQITYQLLNSDTGRFTIDRNSGEVRTAQSFTASEAGTTRTIVVRAISADGSFENTRINISVPGAANTAPTAVDDQFSGRINRDIVVGPAELTANDRDLENDPLTVTVINTPTNGTLSTLIDGTIVYRPDRGFHGGDSFTYVADDGALQSNLATVTIDIANRRVDTGSAPPAPPVAPPPGNPAPVVPGPQPPMGAPFDFDSPSLDPGDSNAGDTSRNESDSDSNESLERPMSRPAWSWQANVSSQGSSDGPFKAGFEVAQANALELVLETLLLNPTENMLDIAEIKNNLHDLELTLANDLRQAILWDMWDSKQWSASDDPVAMVIGTAGLAAGFFSIGYVMWALRGGVVVSILAAGLPAWRIIDPTAVLTAYRASMDEAGEELSDLVRR